MNLPGLHVILSDAVARAAGWEETCARMQERCGAGLALHIRMREVPVRRRLEIAEALEEGAVETGGWLVVNGRLDLALAVGADAVQLGRGSLPIDAVREVAGESLAIGCSVHDLPTADARRLEGADYLVAGAVYDTTSHPGAEPAGLRLIERLAPMPLPVLAIGGIDVARVPEVRSAGAAGVVVISAVWGAPDPVAAALALCEAVNA